AQQQALIRELQSQLPPAQRQAILQALQGRGQSAQITGDDSESRAAFDGDESFLPGNFDFDVEDPRFEGGDTVVIQFDLMEAAAEAGGDSEFRRRLAEGNPYELDRSGVLYLPGVPAISLGGLNVDEATIRVSAEPSLSMFFVTLTRLPLAPVGLEALQLFGYDLFDDVPSTFAPATDIPVPVDYVIGPGDTVYVQLFGNQNAEYFLEVSREGVINFPEIGPLNVSGLSFTDLRNLINERVAEQMIGVRASTTLGELRSIRVFVLGEVERPGSYTVSGLSTMTNALFASGGVKEIGSLRGIALVRDGNTVTTLDLYDLLLRGDTSDDARLQPGDVIFVSPIGETVAVDGEVRRPAIYEIRGERSVGNLVTLAGGLNAIADRMSVKLERIVPSRGTTVRDVNLNDPIGSEMRVQDGDIVRVQRNIEQLENSVRLEGNVFQPGLYEYRDGMRLSDLLPSPDAVMPLTDVNYVLVRREVRPNVQIEVISADLEEIWASRDTSADLLLLPRDTIHVFNIGIGRQHIVSPILEELRQQAPPVASAPTVRVGGRVRAAGDYPLEPGMRVSDLLRAGGGLSDAAYAIEAELTRYAIISGQRRETELVTVNLGALFRGDASADITLQPYDYLNIKELPQWGEQESVTIRGEVIFPGTYPIRQGETLSSVLLRAGGLTGFAFPQGSVFTRVELRQREAEQLQTLATRIESDLFALGLADPSGASAVGDGQALLQQLRNATPTGRLVIALEEVIRGTPGADIVLKDGDQLVVPDQRQEVSVIGEVQYSTSHLFDQVLTRDD
ncbi:MAG TPA: SLBB domain-containing protein, partial [Gammaproteobacteria bacterium]|nr:SLBB domain-containing protein [Gammaproteobacteria bacterium]